MFSVEPLLMRSNRYKRLLFFRLSSRPAMSELQYRTCNHSGEKTFDEQSRVLTYRGNTYRTRVFKIQAPVAESGSSVVGLFSSAAAA